MVQLDRIRVARQTKQSLYMISNPASVTISGFLEYEYFPQVWELGTLIWSVEISYRLRGYNMVWREEGIMQDWVVCLERVARRVRSLPDGYGYCLLVRARHLLKNIQLSTLYRLHSNILKVPFIPTDPCN